MLVYIGQIGDDTPIKEYSNGMLPPSSFGGKLFAGGGGVRTFYFGWEGLSCYGGVFWERIGFGTLKENLNLLNPSIKKYF